ncbi:hypothetical protein F5X96DRAFT_689864 [Biscogniauxia mediterranea]|nr:hypothetical protein F5X96DRAFT_689864 [Biscogniauxia mediterranea]
MRLFELLTALVGFLQLHSNNRANTKMHLAEMKDDRSLSSTQWRTNKSSNAHPYTQSSSSESEPESPSSSPFREDEGDSRRRPRCPISARDMEVIEALFHVPGVPAPGQLSWRRLDRLMRRCGLAKDVGRAGARVAFVPGRGAFVPNGQTGRNLVLHQQHSRDGPLSRQSARDIGRQLYQAYGWTGDMFCIG